MVNFMTLTGKKMINWRFVFGSHSRTDCISRFNTQGIIQIFHHFDWINVFSCRVAKSPNGTCIKKGGLLLKQIMHGPGRALRTAFTEERHLPEKESSVLE